MPRIVMGDKAPEHQRRTCKIILRLVGGGIQVEEIQDILFIQSEGHIQQMYIRDGTVLETRQTLASLQQVLESIVPGQFVSPGKGYLVNQKAIHVIKRDYIELGGHKIPLARRKYRQFQEQYVNYIMAPGE